MLWVWVLIVACSASAASAVLLPLNGNHRTVKIPIGVDAQVHTLCITIHVDNIQLFSATSEIRDFIYIGSHAFTAPISPVYADHVPPSEFCEGWFGLGPESELYVYYRGVTISDRHITFGDQDPPATGITWKNEMDPVTGRAKHFQARKTLEYKGRMYDAQIVPVEKACVLPSMLRKGNTKINLFDGDNTVHVHLSANRDVAVNPNFIGIPLIVSGNPQITAGQLVYVSPWSDIITKTTARDARDGHEYFVAGTIILINVAVGFSLSGMDSFVHTGVIYLGASSILVLIAEINFFGFGDVWLEDTGGLTTAIPILIVAFFTLLSVLSWTNTLSAIIRPKSVSYAIYSGYITLYFMIYSMPEPFLMWISVMMAVVLVIAAVIFRDVVLVFLFILVFGYIPISVLLFSGSITLLEYTLSIAVITLILVVGITASIISYNMFVKAAPPKRRPVTRRRKYH
jgi:hypothetical protein